MGRPPTPRTNIQNQSNNTNIYDETIPEINVPILKPSKPTRNSLVPSLKHLSGRVVNSVSKEINKFADWILSYIPEPIKKTVDKRVNKLKKKINRIFNRIEIDYLKLLNPKLQEAALRGYLKTYRIDGQKGYDPKSFINNIKPKVVNLINQQKKPIKIKFIFTCKFIKENPATGQIDENSGYFHSGLEIVTESTDFSDLFDVMINRPLEMIEKFQNQGSGWQFNQVEHFDINISPFEPLSGSSFIPLSAKLASKKAIINVKNENDHECFKWAVTSAVFPKEKHAERLNKQMRENSEKFDWSGIEFTVLLKDIDKFEKKNNYAINVYTYDVKPGVLRLTKKHEAPVIHLLMISNDETNQYCWIKNMNRFLDSEVSKNKSTRHYCDRCLNSFQSEPSLERHQEYCKNNEVAMVLPMNDDGSPKYIIFKNYNRKMQVPFVVYADFECFTEKIDTYSPDERKSFTKQYQKHKPSGFCYLIKYFDDEVFPPKTVRHTAESLDEDMGSKMFIEHLESDIKDIYNKLKSPKNARMSKKDEITHKNATHCHICEGELGEDKVLDHCHLTGKYRGAAHNKCNLNYKILKFFPVIFHNLSGYDSHLFIKNLGISEGKINCIPNNEEKYISLTKEFVVDSFTNKDGKLMDIKRDIRFIDSFKFMSTSLNSLVNNLPKSSLINLASHHEGKRAQLLTRKGVFPYDWFDSFSRLNATQLPPKEAFYSKLNDSDISEEDYQLAKKVWETLEMKNFRDYHDLYLQTDVILLADVFENYRNCCGQNYGLDPAWYYTAPGLAWDAALKISKVKLELLRDPDMLLMIEKGIRGGISMISTRYGKSNNPYMKEYDPTLPTKYITYLDANGLYGWAMTKPLPTDGFRWMSDEEIINWKDHPCILEVDLEYPNHLHDLHNDYPLAPERVKVNGVDKLIPNLNNKTKYIVHHEALKHYLTLGLKLTKVHRGITFNESAWLKPYINFNTRLRAKAENDFEKDFFKLMNNSVFGKTMENIRNRVDIRLVTKESQARKLISKPIKLSTPHNLL